jgi:hypothetical protein
MQASLPQASGRTSSLASPALSASSAPPEWLDAEVDAQVDALNSFKELKSPDDADWQHVSAKKKKNKKKNVKAHSGSSGGAAVQSPMPSDGSVSDEQNFLLCKPGARSLHQYLCGMDCILDLSLLNDNMTREEATELYLQLCKTTEETAQGPPSRHQSARPVDNPPTVTPRKPTVGGRTSGPSLPPPDSTMREQLCLLKTPGAYTLRHILQQLGLRVPRGVLDDLTTVDDAISIGEAFANDPDLEAKEDADRQIRRDTKLHLRPPCRCPLKEMNLFKWGDPVTEEGGMTPCIVCKKVNIIDPCFRCYECGDMCCKGCANIRALQCSLGQVWVRSPGHAASPLPPTRLVLCVSAVLAGVLAGVWAGVWARVLSGLLAVLC